MFQQKPQNDSSPADEHGRGVQVGYRRPSWNVDASQQAESVEREGQHDQAKCHAMERLFPDEPADGDQEEGKNVEDQASVERWKMVEPLFEMIKCSEAILYQVIDRGIFNLKLYNLCFFQSITKLGQGIIELSGVAFFISGKHNVQITNQRIRLLSH